MVGSSAMLIGALSVDQQMLIVARMPLKHVEGYAVPPTCTPYALSGHKFVNNKNGASCSILVYYK